jgi:hypothetical protein
MRMKKKRCTQTGISHNLIKVMSGAHKLAGDGMAGINLTTLPGNGMTSIAVKLLNFTHADSKKKFVLDQIFYICLNNFDSLFSFFVSIN